VPEQPVAAVVGPTATGKSALAIALAQRFGGEIINAVADRGAVTHHLLDVWPISKSAAVAEYQSMARASIDEIHGRGRLPILVGGSGLYLRGALDHLDFPGESAQVRAQLYDELAEVGPGPLHGRLAGLDPAAAAAILPTNGRRIVRALEVIEITGRPFTATMPGFESIYDCVQIGLDRQDLDERVDQRVRAMMDAGFLDEVRHLLPMGLRDSPTAGKALGYAQLLGCLDDEGQQVTNVGPAVEATIRATRRFVRRQRSWFRRDPRIHWIDAQRTDLFEAAARLLAHTR
jgi:tRNA dimethylallyltransferase